MSEELVACTKQVKNAPVAASPGELGAYTSVFRSVDQIQPRPVEQPRVFIDTAASSHMVSDGSWISTHVVDKKDCGVRIKRSCGTSNATKKGTLLL